MTRAILINEERNSIKEIDIDISPEKNEIFKILKGKASFVGQWPDEDVVIIKCSESIFELQLNQNRLTRESRPRTRSYSSLIGRPPSRNMSYSSENGL